MRRRAPGDFPGLLVIESVIEHVAAHLGLEPSLVRERNIRQPKPGGEGCCCEHAGCGTLPSTPVAWNDVPGKLSRRLRAPLCREHHVHERWHAHRRRLAVHAASHLGGEERVREPVGRWTGRWCL